MENMFLRYKLNKLFSYAREEKSRPCRAFRPDIHSSFFFSCDAMTQTTKRYFSTASYKNEITSEVSKCIKCTTWIDTGSRYLAAATQHYNNCVNEKILTRVSQLSFWSWSMDMRNKRSCGLDSVCMYY